MFSVCTDKKMSKKSIDNIVQHAEVSEKAIERYLCEVVKKLGGVCHLQ